MTINPKTDWFRLACAFLAPDVPIPKSADEIDAEEEAAINDYIKAHPNPRHAPVIRCDQCGDLGATIPITSRGIVRALCPSCNPPEDEET